MTGIRYYWWTRQEGEVKVNKTYEALNWNTKEERL